RGGTRGPDRLADVRAAPGGPHPPPPAHGEVRDVPRVRVRARKLARHPRAREGDRKPARRARRADQRRARAAGTPPSELVDGEPLHEGAGPRADAAARGRRQGVDRWPRSLSSTPSSRSTPPRTSARERGAG